MSGRMTIAALAAAAMLALAACGGEEETPATPVSDATTPSAQAQAAADVEAGIEQLREQVETIEMRLEEMESRLQERVEAIESRLGDVEPSDLSSRVGQAEAEIERLSEAVQVLQAPQDVGTATTDPEGSPASPSPEPND